MPRAAPPACWWREIDWQWVVALHRALVTEPDRDAGIDVLVLGRDGQVDIGPPALLGRPPKVPGLGMHSAGAPGVLPWPDGQRYLSVALTTPVAGADANLTLIVRQNEKKAYAATERLRRRLLQGGALATLVFMGLSFWLGGRVAKPVRALSRAANQLAARRGGELCHAAPRRWGRTSRPGRRAA